MSTKLKAVLERIETWPEEVQDEAAETLLSLEEAATTQYDLSAEDREALAKSADDVRHGRFVDSERLMRFFDRYRRS
jgi:hypothetical protein